MHEDRRAKLLSLGPKRVKPWVGDMLAEDVTADRRTAMSEFVHRVLQLCGRELRMLQRDGRQRHEPVGMVSHPGTQCFGVHAYDAAR